MNAEAATCMDGCDLRAGLIPEESLLKGYYGEWDGVTPQYFSRLIGISCNDRVQEWLCPDCGVRQNRFTKERIPA